VYSRHLTRELTELGHTVTMFLAGDAVTLLRTEIERMQSNGVSLMPAQRLYATEAGTSITMRAGPGYPYAQVWVPAGRPFAALEPMTAATNSLVDGTATLVAPGDAFAARFTLSVGEPHW